MNPIYTPTRTLRNLNPCIAPRRRPPHTPAARTTQRLGLHRHLITRGARVAARAPALDVAVSIVVVGAALRLVLVVPDAFVDTAVVVSV
jgi:hypothetical protein